MVVWRGHSDGALDAGDEGVRRITGEFYAEARPLPRENPDKFDRIVERLVIHETLDEPDVYAAAFQTLVDGVTSVRSVN